MQTAEQSLVPIERIDQHILLLRGQKVMIDSELARLYGVRTKRLNEQVQRNIDRFPSDFMFQLNAEEFEFWRSQIATSNSKAKMGIRRRPYAFTEQGVSMLSSVLRSKRAVHVNIEIMRAFVRLRRLVNSHDVLSRKLAALEAKYADHDAKITAVFEAIRQLMTPDVPEKKGRIGFRIRE